MTYLKIIGEWALVVAGAFGVLLGTKWAIFRIEHRR